MELCTGLMTVLASVLRSKVPATLTGMDTDSREPYCLKNIVLRRKRISEQAEHPGRGHSCPGITITEQQQKLGEWNA